MRKILLLLFACFLSACAAWPQEPVPESTITTGTTETTAATTAPATEPSAFPTTETTQPTVEETTQPAPEPEDGDFVRIQDYIPTALVRLAYATEENFTGVPIYGFTDAYLRYGTVKKLMQAAEILEEQGFGILVWDAFRPVYAQQRLWDAYPDPAYVSPPGTGTQSHCRGCAVDVTLYDLQTGIPLEMPTGFDDFSRYADRDYSDVPRKAAENAILLESVMAGCGFKPYRGEWWHFTDTQSYGIEYDFDPADNS